MIRILTTYYQSLQYLEKCIKSIQRQNVKDWKCYITDDMSGGDHPQMVKNLIGDDDRFEYIENKKKMYQTGNYWQVLQKDEIDDEDICTTIDGDDWLPYDYEVFDRLLSYFSDGKTLLSFGQFLFYKGNNEYHIGSTKRPVPLSQARYTGWTSSHLRAFKAHMLRRVKKEDITRPNGEFFEAAGDVVCFSPMLEMAGEDRVKYVQDINYIYNLVTPMNECKTCLDVSMAITDIISKKPRYELI